MNQFQKSRNLILFIITFLFNQYLSNLQAFSFLAQADTHSGNKKRKLARKLGHLEIMVDLIDNNNISFVIMPGDLTDNGLIGSSIFCCIPQYDEWSEFCEKWLRPIQGIPVYLCAGNHDIRLNRNGILKEIKVRHGNVYYSFTMDENGKKSYFICCNIYPNKEIRNWLANQKLPTIGEKAPVFFFFHYPPIGKASNDWPQKEKDEFYNLIKNYNVKAIIVGHNGKFSYASSWNNIPLFCLAGYHFGFFDFNSLTEKLQAKFYSATETKSAQEMFIDPQNLDVSHPRYDS